MATTWWRGSASLPSLVVATSKTTHGFAVVTVVTCVVVVTIHRSVAWILRRLYNARLLMIEDNFSHPLKGHLNPFALLEHVVDLFQPWHRLWCHANALIFMRTLSVNFGKFSDASGSVGHLIERSLNIKTLQMPLDRLAIWG
jgi:hypothetical protein